MFGAAGRVTRRRAWAAVAGAVLVAGAATGLVLSEQPGPRPPADPMDYYPAAAVRSLVSQTAAIERRADRLTAGWLAKNGTSNDSGFAAFAVRQVGPVPSSTVQDGELRMLHELADRRSAEGLAAAAELEAHGEKDVWVAYGDRYDALPGHGHDASNLIDAAYKLGDDVATAAQQEYRRLSPYEVDPSLNGTLHRDATRGKFGFPSGHATLAAAEATIMARLEPQRAASFRFLECEVDYSRLYVAAHYPSDVLRGALLGRLVGDYTLADHPEWLPHG